MITLLKKIALFIENQLIYHSNLFALDLHKKEYRDFEELKIISKNEVYSSIIWLTVSFILGIITPILIALAFGWDPLSMVPRNLDKLVWVSNIYGAGFAIWGFILFYITASASTSFAGFFCSSAIFFLGGLINLFIVSALQKANMNLLVPIMTVLIAIIVASVMAKKNLLSEVRENYFSFLIKFLVFSFLVSVAYKFALRFMDLSQISPEDLLILPYIFYISFIFLFTLYFVDYMENELSKKAHPDYVKWYLAFRIVSGILLIFVFSFKLANKKEIKD